MNNTSNKKEKVEFTKIMEIFVTITFYLFYLFSIFIWIFQDRCLINLIYYISRPFALLTSSYIIKSAIVNTNRINKNYDPNKQKKISFSKILTMLIFISFAVSLLFFIIFWFFTDRFSSELIEYIGTPFISILPCYMGKAVAESKALDNATFSKIIDSINDIATSGVSSMNVGSIDNELVENLNKKEDD